MFDLFKRMITDSDLANLEKALVITNDGGYTLFGEFFIKPENGMFVVEKFHTSMSEEFYTLRNAVAWATLYKRELVGNANRVKDLDKLLEGATVSLEVHTKLYKKAKDIDKKLIYSAKLQEDKLKKSRITAELNRFILNSKNWQEKRFKEAVK